MLLDPLDQYPAMMTSAEVAEYMGLDSRQLAEWRYRPPEGGGPPYVKVTPGRNGLVRYPRERLRAYLAERMKTGWPPAAERSA